MLAQAQFAQANFSAAAAAYRKILETSSALPEIIVSYAQALAAADRKSAASEFRLWADGTKGEKPREAEVAVAGLSLLAGDSGAAHRLEIELKQSGDPRTPVWLGELGWWHYLNANYEKSVELLSEAVQQRPGDLDLGLHLAWVQIEVRRYSDALQTLDSVNYERQTSPEKAIIQAVARWQAQERDEAIRAFGIAMGSQPEWENPKWVMALYSPLVAHSVQEMQAEGERRRQKIRAAAGR